MAGRCSDKQPFSWGSLADVDPDEVGRESVVGVQFTSWGDHQVVVAALDVCQPVLARYRHSRRLSVEHGQDSRTLNGTFLGHGHWGQNEILNKHWNKLRFRLMLVLCIVPSASLFIFLCDVSLHQFAQINTKWPHLYSQVSNTAYGLWLQQMIKSCMYSMGLFPQMHCAFLNVHNDVKQCSGRSSSVHLPPAAGYKLAIPVTNWVRSYSKSAYLP